jgi:hypothetical protein
MKVLLVVLAVTIFPNFARGNSRPEATSKACTTSIASVVAAHTRNWSQIWLGSITEDDRGMHIRKLTPITHRPGYNNQPAFSNDGSGIYYSWRPDNSEADIWYHEIKTGKEWPVTCTPQDEYSPALVPEADEISVVSLEDEGKRRLWKIPLHGGESSSLFPNLTSVAYYAWANADTVVLNFTDPARTQALTLAIGKVSSGSIEQIGTGFSQSLARVPNSDAVSYIDKSEGQGSRLMAMDPASRKISVILMLPENMETYAWLPDGRIIAPIRSLIMIWSPREETWKQIADLSALMPNGISRLVANEKGSRLLLVKRVK